MNRILAVSVAIVAFGLLSGSTRLAPETRSFAYMEKGWAGGGETVTRTGDMISGDMAVGAKHAHYEGRIAADGTIPRLEIRAWRSAAEAKNPRVMSFIVGRDSTQFIDHRGRHADTLRFASQPGLLPIINPSIGLIELAVARARSQKSRSAKVPILVIDALGIDVPATDSVHLGVAPMDVTFLAADTVRLGTPTSKDQLRVIIGADGHCRGAMSGSTTKDKFSMRPTSKPVASLK